MEIGSSTPKNWSGVKSLEDAKALVDLGVLLAWKDVKAVQKVCSDEDAQHLVRYFAVRLAERIESRLPEEILIESMLVFMANNTQEEVLNAFLDELTAQPDFVEACLVLVEVALTAEISDAGHYDDIFAFAIALICELGLLIRDIDAQYPDELGRDGQQLLDHIATYLLSVSNTNNNCVRLSLVQYFADLEGEKETKSGFNRIFGRFGHTVMEHLFTLLFNKKTEAVALQYLLENMKAVLEADNHAQKILHETWKYYMLKRPDRFALFLQTLAEHLGKGDQKAMALAQRVFMQHLVVLLKIVSEVNHKELAREIMCGLMSFEEGEFRQKLIEKVIADTAIRASFRTLMSKFSEASKQNNVVDKFESFRSSKRGRKPSFAKSEKKRPIHQVTYLASQTVARAS